VNRDQLTDAQLVAPGHFKFFSNGVGAPANQMLGTWRAVPGMSFATILGHLTTGERGGDTAFITPLPVRRGFAANIEDTGAEKPSLISGLVNAIRVHKGADHFFLQQAAERHQCGRHLQLLRRAHSQPSTNPPPSWNSPLIST